MAFCLVGGVAGYKFIEDVTWLEAIYVVIQVFSTVGLEKPSPGTDAGRFFLIVLILVYLTSFTVALSVLVRYISSGDLARKLKTRWREQRAHRMKNHFIVCGCGRLGSQVVAALRTYECDILVVEQNEEVVDEVSATGLPVIHGDATEDGVLQRANVGEAQGLVATLADDAENVFLTLTAREYNTRLRIVARANSERSRRKLRLAGAEQVILPQNMGGDRIARVLLQPTVARFLEVVSGEGSDLVLRQWTVPEQSDLVGKTLGQTQFRTRFGLSVLGVAKSLYDIRVANVMGTVLEAGDTLIVLGPGEDFEHLRASG